MSLIVKSIVGFGVGVAVVAAVQSAGMWSLKQYLRSDRAMMAGVPVMGAALPDYGANFKKSGVIEALVAKPIDTSLGQRLAVEGAARRVDMQIRAAQSAVPLPVRIPGMR